MLSTILLIACIASIGVAQIFVLRSALGAPIVARDVHLPRVHRASEIVWAVLPAIALAVVLWVTWRESRALNAAPTNPPAEHAGHRAHTS